MGVKVPARRRLTPARSRANIARMARPPFDPNRVRAPAANVAGGALFGAGSADDRPMTVTQLSSLIRGALANAAPAKLKVVGEISNFSARNHWFFSMKDAAATVRCVCFASSARRVKFPVKDGMQVVATGRLDYYDAQGSVQLYVDSLEPVGQGSLELQFRALCDELRKLGYFDPARKKPLPAVPLKIAVITSKTGAALQDVISTARNRWSGCRLLLFDVRVQGAQAAPEIAHAIDLISEQGEALGIDAIILTRGGGSIEDLWAFNERIVADALLRCRLPTVAAIGHETDTTIAELVADLRAATPTQAAMQLVPDQAMLAQQLEQCGRRLTLQLERRMQLVRQRVDAMARHPYFRSPARMLEPSRVRMATLRQRLRAELPRRAVMESQRLENLQKRFDQGVAAQVARETQRLAGAERALVALGPRVMANARTRAEQVTRELEECVAQRMTAVKEQVASAQRQLNAVSPQRVLDRGFSYTLGADGKVLKSTSQVVAGEMITSVLADGKLRSRVEGGVSGPVKLPVRRAKSDSGSSGEGSLFESPEEDKA